MNIQDLTFFVHNHNLAPSYSVPALDAYQAQKNIQVVSNSNPEPGSLTFGNERAADSGRANTSPTSEAFFAMRLHMALELPTVSTPSYFPGSLIPGPGGATCAEVARGNLLFEQFQHMLAFDGESLSRISQLANGIKTTAAPSRLHSRPGANSEAWLWQFVERPKLYTLHKKPLPDSHATISEAQALAIFGATATELLQAATEGRFDEPSVTQLLTLISAAWFVPSSGIAPVTWGPSAIDKTRAALLKHQRAITDQNILPFLFELEAMASHISLSEEREGRRSFARGVFAGNFIEVAMAPITSIKPTEYCVRERLLTK